MSCGEIHLLYTVFTPQTQPEWGVARESLEAGSISTGIYVYGTLCFHHLTPFITADRKHSWTNQLTVTFIKTAGFLC